MEEKAEEGKSEGETKAKKEMRQKRLEVLKVMRALSGRHANEGRKEREERKRQERKRKAILESGENAELNAASEELQRREARVDADHGKRRLQPRVRHHIRIGAQEGGDGGEVQQRSEAKDGGLRQTLQESPMMKVQAVRIASTRWVESVWK